MVRIVRDSLSLASVSAFVWMVCAVTHFAA
jgi:hypothetical protein